MDCISVGICQHGHFVKLFLNRSNSFEFRKVARFTRMQLNFLAFMSKVHFPSLLLPCFAYPDDAIDQLEGSLCTMILTSLQSRQKVLN